MKVETRRLKNAEAGFVVSSEVLLIGVIIVCGLITGWAKLRDQSLAEIKDSIDAIDAYLIGSAPTLQPYAQQWITASASGGVVSCSPVTPVPATCVAPVTEEYTPPGGGPGIPASPINLNYGTGLTPTVGSGGAFETSTF